MAPAPASEHLFTIGQFSRLTDLSCPMLRHYDQLGLLRPSTVDDETGYRYYSLAQLDVAEAIRLLRDLDVPLTEVADILAAPDRECTERLLANHRTRIGDILARQQAIMDRVEDSLTGCHTHAAEP